VYVVVFLSINHLKKMVSTSSRCNEYHSTLLV